VIAVTAAIAMIGVALPIAALSHDQAPVVPGHPVQIGGPTIDGGYVDPAHLNGKILVVGFWASWCSPCRTQLAAMQAVATRYQGDPHVAVVGVNLDAKANTASEFAHTVGASFPSIASSQGLASSYGIDTLPMVWVLDQSGKVVGTFPAAYPGLPTPRHVAPLAHAIDGAVGQAQRAFSPPAQAEQPSSSQLAAEVAGEIADVTPSGYAVQWSLASTPRVGAAHGRYGEALLVRVVPDSGSVPPAVRETLTSALHGAVLAHAADLAAANVKSFGTSAGSVASLALIRDVDQSVPSFHPVRLTGPAGLIWFSV